ncbi:metal ABC transporter substrate-binding protein [Dellaglioa algida]|uniref:metal ABC transporter substrate-binding protein n=1 Tax=Dellaglioa algida TaxID=105612 RepID=UPI0024C49151|nr:metal ABC transporter substrate-binding protein [Dellaglioa algida]MDK1728414.1 metal ABC transporter substrate-binding protein [Dellaglioa algida]MDK1735983.1 metal ABC transporter substrate-binding protein [Dellaglioa algida]MDK1737776.1 metal ABC transporter substrate-binding protein [Dellaglioa algida]
MHKKSVLVGLLLMLFVVVLAGCGQTTANKGSNKLQVVTTFYPIYEFTKAVAGSDADVTMLMPAGTEPHDYEPSAKDIGKISQANVFIYSSNNMETWVGSLKSSIDEGQTKILNASHSIKMIDENDELKSEEAELADKEETTSFESTDNYDPHIWLDPENAKEMVTNISKELIQQDPKHKQDYVKRTNAYLKKLTTLNTEYETTLKNAKNKTFVTQHAAFAYLAKQYGLTQVAIAGISSDGEPSPNRLAELQTYIKKYHVDTIFTEANDSSKIANMLARETNIKVKGLNPIEGLSKAQIESGETYLSVMQDNLKSLKTVVK